MNTIQDTIQDTNQRTFKMKWEIKRMPGCFKGDPCYYQVKLNGHPVISFSKKRTAEQFVKMFGKELEENEKRFQEEFLF